MRTILIVAGLIFALSLNAQLTKDQRNVETKIADLLARMPAKNYSRHIENMQEMESLKEKGLEQLALTLKDPKENDNAAIEYALGGFSFYVSGPNQEAARGSAAIAYHRALAKTTIVENKIFLINQLGLVGKDDVTGYLLNYLNDPLLADAVIRSLVKINTSTAQEILLNASYSSSGLLRLRLIEALGEIRLNRAASYIGSLLPSEDKQHKKVMLFALSRIANRSSLPLLSKEAAAVSFEFDTVAATASYITYLKNLYEKGFKTEVDKAAWEVWNQATNVGAKKARYAMLGLLAKTRGRQILPLLMKVTDEDDRAHRVYAFNLAVPYINDKDLTGWILLTKQSKPAVKRDLIAMLAKTANRLLLPVFVEAMDDPDTDVRIAAIKAAVLVGGHHAQASLIERLQQADSVTIQTITAGLLEMKGSGLNTDHIADVLSTVPDNLIPALLNILSAKAAVGHVDKVLAYTTHSDKKVRDAAFAALPFTATVKVTPTLYSLLITTGNDTHIKNIQLAIVNALSAISDTSERINHIKSAMLSAPVNKQYLFLDMFAKIGNRAALQTVTEASRTESAEIRMAAVNALADWSNSTAVEPLYKSVLQYKGQAGFEKVLMRYLDLVRKTRLTDEQRLLELRRAMEIATTNEHRIAILKETGRCHTFPALLFTGKYLDDPFCQPHAALSVSQIVLSDNKGWNGSIVSDIISKAILHMTGSDAEYQKKALQKHLDELTKGDGFISLFNGKDLVGWKGLVENPIKRAAMTSSQLQAAQEKANVAMREGWTAKDGLLIFNGHGGNLCTDKQYGDFEMYIDWQITPEGDAGVYLRGTPQVQIWDTARVKVGAQVGSGGLYNNRRNPSKPLELADNAIGAWNSFYIKMIGEKVTVYLNGKLVVDNVVLENYWDRTQPIFPMEQIELQAHGTYVAYRDIYIREIPRVEKFVLSAEEQKEGYQILFDGTNLDAWTGNTTDYIIENGVLAVRPTEGSKNGNLYTKEEFRDFVYRLEFKLTPGANNGIGVRTPLTGDAAYEGMEIQMLDDEAPIYSNLKPYQYHGSVYGLISAKRGYLKPVGEWNYQEIQLIGNKIVVKLNGVVILDGDLAEATRKGTLDKLEHPGSKRKNGHIAFLGHGEVVFMKNIRIKKI